MAEELAPGLYVVATPIGNLGDLGARAAETLRRADLILVEDTRVTGKLLAHIAAKTRMARYDDHASEAERERIVAMLAHHAIALVSDAGTPLISDPGYKLVRAARAAGRAVRTIPGPSALIAALTLAGLPTDRFLFAGFLPAKTKAKVDALAELAQIRATMVFYESGPRLADTLTTLAKQFGDRGAAVARELTKLHEECVSGSLEQLAARYSSEAPPKGELVIVVGPPEAPTQVSDADLDAALDEALRDLTPSRAAAQVAETLRIPRKRVYARALERAK